MTRPSGVGKVKLSGAQSAVIRRHVTVHDRELVEQFGEFLRCAGPPLKPGDPIQAGPLARLEHRPDLIRYMLGVE